MAYERIQKELSLIEQTNPINNNSEMYDAVKKILDKEMRKRKNKDCELIDECVETLLMLKGTDIDRLPEKTEIYSHKALNEIQKETNSGPKLNLFRRKYIAATIILTSLILLSSMAMIAFEYNPIIEIYKMITSNKSEQNSITENNITENNITYTYLDNTKSYNSIDELISNENIDIIYPLNLPDDIRIIDIHKNEIDGYDQINIVFNTDQLLFMINGKHLMNIEDFTNYNKYDIEDIEMYIFTRNNEHEAIFYHNNYEYNITSTDYEILIEIINNLSIPS